MTDFVKAPSDEEELVNWLDRLRQAMARNRSRRGMDVRLVTPSTEPSVISADKTAFGALHQPVIAGLGRLHIRIHEQYALTQMKAGTPIGTQGGRGLVSAASPDVY